MRDEQLLLDAIDANMRASLPSNALVSLASARIASDADQDRATIVIPPRSRR